jgi:hypothetical protein
VLESTFDEVLLEDFDAFPFVAPLEVGPANNGLTLKTTLNELIKNSITITNAAIFPFKLLSLFHG